MNRILEERGGRVLAFGAHPGGLLARLAANGAKVTMVVVSVPNRLEERRAEAQAAADVLDADLFVLHEDQPMRVEDVPMHELVRRFDQLVGDMRPDLVITHSANDLHWDHGLVNRATVSALRRTPCDLLSYLSSPEMNAQARSLGTCFADITGHLDTKLAAISCHRSQLTRLDLASTHDLARAMGRTSGHPYAETFEILRLRI